jgi:hypothetical protein
MTHGATFPQQSFNSTTHQFACPAVEHTSSAAAWLLFCTRDVYIANTASTSTRPLRAHPAKFPNNAFNVIALQVRFYPNIRHSNTVLCRHAKWTAPDTDSSQSSFFRNSVTGTSDVRCIRGPSVPGNKTIVLDFLFELVALVST